MKTQIKSIKLLLLASAVMVLLGCGGDIDNLPPLGSDLPPGSVGDVYGSCESYNYCYDGISKNECENYYYGYFVPNGTCDYYYGEPSYSSSSQASAWDYNSSSSQGYYSSSSLENAMLSSSSYSPPPPPPAPVDYCFETIPDNQMSCNWDNASNPGGTIISGDMIRFSGKVYSNLDCNERVYLSVSLRDGLGINSPVFDAEYEFYSDKDKNKLTKTSGELIVTNPYNGKTGTFTWPSPAAGVTASISDPAAIYAEVKCTVNGTSDVLACGTKDCTSSLKIMGAPSPIPNKTTLTWSNAKAYSSSSIFYSGDIPALIKDITVSNMVESRCGSVDYRVVNVSTNAKYDGAITNTGTTYINIRAEAFCTGTGEVLATAAAVVVPNPSLTCYWANNVLPKGQFAIPLMTLFDAYNRCGTVTYSGGFPRELTEADVGTINNVFASVSCTGIAITQNCGTLTVTSE